MPSPIPGTTICNSSPTRAHINQQVGPDTGVREHLTTSTRFRTADLQQARSILAEEVSHLICLPLEHLWESYPLNANALANVKQHLAQKKLLSDDGKWNPTIRKERFAKKLHGVHEADTFNIFSRTFNGVVSSLADCGGLTPGCVERMVHAGSIKPQSDRTSSHRPDAFLLVHAKSPQKPTKDGFRWRDITCPFEYKFGNGDTIDVSHRESTVLQEVSSSFKE